MSTLTVLRQGYRKPVKVTPQTLLAQILFDACRQFQLDPTQHTLRKVDAKQNLDMSVTLKQTGLAVSCTLELVSYKIPANASINAAFQISSGKRHIIVAKPLTTLWDALKQLEVAAQTNITTNESNGKYTTPFLQIQGKDIDTLEGLTGETFYHYGLVSGNILIRVNFKESTKSLAEWKQEYPTAFSEIQYTATESAPNPTKTESTEDSPMIESQPNPSKSESEPESEKPVESPIIAEETPNSPESIIHETVSAPENIPESVSNRELKLFRPSQKDFDPSRFDIPDEFYEMTAEDLREINAKAEERRKASETLMTKSMRERNDAPVKYYKKTYIRIRFPNGFVAQGTFSPKETISAVTEFAKTLLANPSVDFYLYVAPPVQKFTAPSATLQSLSLVPAALINFGFVDKGQPVIFREELVDQSMDLSVAVPIIEPVKPVTNASSSSSAPKTNPAEDSESTATDENQAPRTKDGTKIPKWLKRPTNK